MGAGRAQPHAAVLQTLGPPCKPGLANSSEADRSPPLWVALGDRLWGPEGLLVLLPVLPSIPGAWAALSLAPEQQLPLR